MISLENRKNEKDWAQILLLHHCFAYLFLIYVVLLIFCVLAKLFTPELTFSNQKNNHSEI